MPLCSRAVEVLDEARRLGVDTCAKASHRRSGSPRGRASRACQDPDLPSDRAPGGRDARPRHARLRYRQALRRRPPYGRCGVFVVPSDGSPPSDWLIPALARRRVLAALVLFGRCCGSARTSRRRRRVARECRVSFRCDEWGELGRHCRRHQQLAAVQFCPRRVEFPRPWPQHLGRVDQDQRFHRRMFSSVACVLCSRRPSVPALLCHSSDSTPATSQWQPVRALVRLPIRSRRSGVRPSRWRATTMGSSCPRCPR